MNHQTASDGIYVLGHSEHELQRLIDQSRFYGDLTEQVFQRAGLGAGMRLLDAGCGPGDVAFLAAKFVGPTGAITGVDRSADSIAMARARAAAAKLENVTFIECDLAELTLQRPVDAVVGRLVLMYSADPVTILRRIAGQVRAGGLIAFHEMDMTSARCLPASDLFEQCIYWITETFRRGRIELQMGLKLHQTFVGAGLPAPRMMSAARIEAGPDSQVYEYIVQTLRSLLPMIVRLGVATAEEMQIETLARRLRSEAMFMGCVMIAPLMVGAWARKPYA